MKKVLLNIFLLVLSVSAFGVSGLCQSKATSEADASNQKIENIQLRFTLSAFPDAEAVGLNNSKSYWELEYKVKLSDEKILQDVQSKVNSKYERPGDKSKWIPKANKKIYKKWKKSGTFITEGKFLKTQLSSEHNLDITIPVNLSPEVIKTLTEMETSPDKPSFVLSVKGKIFTKTPSKYQYKKKYKMTFEYPMKMYKNEKSYLLYNTFGTAISLTEKDGRISYEISRL